MSSFPNLRGPVHHYRQRRVRLRLHNCVDQKPLPVRRHCVGSKARRSPSTEIEERHRRTGLEALLRLVAVWHLEGVLAARLSTTARSRRRRIIAPITRQFLIDVLFGLRRLLVNQGVCQAVAALLANTLLTYLVPRFITPDKAKRRQPLSDL